MRVCNLRRGRRSTRLLFSSRRAPGFPVCQGRRWEAVSRRAFTRIVRSLGSDSSSALPQVARDLFPLWDTRGAGWGPFLDACYSGTPVAHLRGARPGLRVAEPGLRGTGRGVRPARAAPGSSPVRPSGDSPARPRSPAVPGGAAPPSSGVEGARSRPERPLGVWGKVTLGPRAESRRCI